LDIADVEAIYEPVAFYLFVALYVLFKQHAVMNKLRISFLMNTEWLTSQSTKTKKTGFRTH